MLSLSVNFFLMIMKLIITCFHWFFYYYLMQGEWTGGKKSAVFTFLLLGLHLMECVGRLCKFLSLSELSITCQLSQTVHKEIHFKFQGLTPLFKNVLHLPATCLVKCFVLLITKVICFQRVAKPFSPLSRWKDDHRWDNGAAAVAAYIFKSLPDLCDTYTLFQPKNYF